MADSSRFVDISVRIYRSLVMHVYPASFRKRYGSEMTWVFCEMVTDSTREHGAVGLIATWCHVFGDLACSAFHQHLIELQGRWEMATAPGWIARLLAVLSVACFWMIPFSPVLAIGGLLTTKGSLEWSRKLAVAGAVLSTVWTLMAAALFLWLFCLRMLHGSWSF